MAQRYFSEYFSVTFNSAQFGAIRRNSGLVLCLLNQIFDLSLSEELLLSPTLASPISEKNTRRLIMKTSLGVKIRSFILATAFSAGLGF
ncbi:MAG TPA: hypothetical protein VF243_03225, partial [Nitrosospira sp.]